MCLVHVHHTYDSLPNVTSSFALGGKVLDFLNYTVWVVLHHTCWVERPQQSLPLCVDCHVCQRLQDTSCKRGLAMSC